VLEGGERVADHGGDIHGSDGVIEGPEGFGTVGIELVELLELHVWQSRERDQGLIERSQQGEGIEAGDFQSRPEVGWEGWRTAMAHTARMTRSPSARKGGLGAETVMRRATGASGAGPSWPTAR